MCSNLLCLAIGDAPTDTVRSLCSSIGSRSACIMSLRVRLLRFVSCVFVMCMHASSPLVFGRLICGRSPARDDGMSSLSQGPRPLSSTRRWHEQSQSRSAASLQSHGMTSLSQGPRPLSSTRRRRNPCQLGSVNFERLPEVCLESVRLDTNFCPTGPVSSGFGPNP